MVKVGNQGLDDRYIRLRSHRISHPVVSGLRQSHSITFLRPGFRPGFHVWFRSTKKLWQKKKIHKSFLVVIVGRRVVSPGKMHIPRCRHFPMQKRPGLQSSPSTILQQNFRF